MLTVEDFLGLFDFYSHNLAKGVEKVAFSLAMMASVKVAEVTQAPMAGPLAAIIKGLGNSIKALKMAALFS